MTEVARRGRVRLANWERVTHGVHVAAGRADERHDRLTGWQLAMPSDACFTSVTGAEIRGWWLPALPSAVPVFAAASVASARTRRSGLVVCRQAERTPYDVIHGLRVAGASDVLLAAARDLSFLDLVVLTDAALHFGDCAMDDLVRAADRHRWGAPALRRVLPHVDGRAESAWESLLRMLCTTCAVPVDPQYVVSDGGLFVARADLRITDTNRLLEYDGEGHRRARQHSKDLVRDRRLLRLGWQRFGYTSEILVGNALSVLRDADQALHRLHRPERIRAWHRLLAESSFTPAGRARLGARWGDPKPDPAGVVSGSDAAAGRASAHRRRPRRRSA
ncbi:MAG: hypothetical protein H0T85_09930 [Geodermatophilaceae bacterium]|nr:hypothetical protein [Geodermatophilaceae bacterium]